MSQQKNLTNFDKGKLLAFLRDWMAWSLEDMAERLNVATLYLAQLERGQHSVDDWYLERAKELARSFSQQANN